MSARNAAIAFVGGLAICLGAASTAFAAGTPGPPSGVASTSHAAAVKKKPASNGNCSAGALLLNAANPFSGCNLASQAVHGATQLPGDIGSAVQSAAGAVAQGVMGQVNDWMVGAAQSATGWVYRAMVDTTTPELTSSSFESWRQYLLIYAAALAGFFALLGIYDAVRRQDPAALGEVFLGIVRAAIGSAVVVALTLLALQVAGAVSSDVAQYAPRQWFTTLDHSWVGAAGGLGASALTFLAALVAVLASVLVWIELLFRQAAIYLAILFYAFALAAAVRPAHNPILRKLTRALVVFIALQPVVVIALTTGINLTFAGTGLHGWGDVGTAFSGLIVLLMAGFAPWALLHLLGLEAGAMGSTRSGAQRRGAAPDGGRVGGGLFAGQVSGESGEAGGGLRPAFAGAGAGTQTSSTSRQGGSSPGGLRSGGGHGSGAHGGGGRSSDGSAPLTGGAWVGSGGARRAVAGAVAAAAGWVRPAADTARRVGQTGQWIGDHAAARVHASAGLGGSAPPKPGLSAPEPTPRRAATRPFPPAPTPRDPNNNRGTESKKGE